MSPRMKRAGVIVMHARVRKRKGKHCGFGAANED